MRLRHDDPLAAELGELPLFEGVTRRELRRVAPLFSARTARPGELLMLERFHGEEFVVVTRGTARVAHGKDVIARVGPGGFLGEIGLLEGVDRTATVIAETSMRLLTLDAEGFTQLMGELPTVARRIQQERELRRRVADDATTTT